MRRKQLVGLVAGVALAASGFVAATSQNAAPAPLVSSAAFRTITLVQQSTATSFAGTTNTVTLAKAPGVGSMLLLVFRNGNDSNDVTSVAGGGVNWVKAQSWTSPSIGDIWYGLNSTGVGTAITINLSGVASGTYAAGVSEWSGVATTNALDGAPAPATGTSTTPTTPSITPAVPGELFVGLISSAGAFTPGTVGGGFTKLGLGTNDGAGYLIGTDSSAHAMSWTTTNAAFTAGAVSFDPALVPAPAPTPAVTPAVVITPTFTG